MSHSIYGNGKSISRRNFLRGAGVAAAGGLAIASGMPRFAFAQDATAAATADIKGTNLTILWLEPSIVASKETRQKAMEDWAAAAGVNLTLETIALDKLAEKLATMTELGGGADLVEMYAMDVAVNAPVMSDLTSLATSLDKTLGGWYNGPKSVCIREDGTWRALPVAVFGQYWHYRTDLIPTWPTTWEELHKVGTPLKAAGTPIGFTLGPAVTDGATHCYSLLWSYGGAEFAEDGKTITLDSPETLDCLTFFESFYHDALDEDSFGWNETGNNNAYLSGEVCATNNANTVYTGLAKNAPDLVDKTSLGGPPAGPAGAFQYFSMDYMGIPSYAANPAAAQAFLRDSFYTLDFQSAWTKSGNGYNLPAFAGLESSDAPWPTDPNLAAARTLAKSSRMPGSPGPFTTAVGQSMNKFLIINMFAAVAQGTAPKDAIASTVDEMNNILKGQ